MTKINTLKTIVVACAMTMLCTASANSIGFELDVYAPESGQVSIDLVYDFSDFIIIQGSVDITYDSAFIEFVSFTRAPYQPDVTPPASPNGALISPGLYSGVGLGHLGPFGSGISSAGPVGTFVFSVIGTPTNSTPCGATLCITGNALNPFISGLTGADVTDELLGNGFDSAEVVVVPLPAGVWLLLSGVISIAGLRRASFFSS